MANILQCDVPGLFGPSPGAKLNLHFYNIYSLWSKCKCKFHILLRSSKISFYCKRYFCSQDTSADLRMKWKNPKSSLVTEEWGLWSAWPRASASDSKHGQTFHHSVSYPPHICYLRSHHTSQRISLLGGGCLIMCSELCQNLTRWEKLGSLH